QEDEPLLEGAGAVAHELELRVVGVLEQDEETSPQVRADFADPCKVDDRAPVDANELPRIQPLFELAQRAVHQVAARRRHRDRDLSLGHEVGDLGSFDQLRALLAEVDADAVGIGGRASLAVVTREPLQYGLDARGIGVGPAAFEALEGALDALAL